MPPIAFRGLIRMASWLVPRGARPPWRARWDSGLADWWTLVERGELIRGTSAQVARTIRVAFVDAFWMRCNKSYLRSAVRGPGFLLLAAAAVWLLVALSTRGFAVTRALIEVAMGQPAAWLTAAEGPRGTLIAYLVPIVFALAAGLVLVAVGGLALRPSGSRYWCFLALKTIAAAGIVCLLWIEGGTAMRAHIRNPQLRALAGGVGLALLFILAFGCALVWICDDQRRRCPICLRRLGMPVRIGSWGSAFDPPVTELLCDQGHGALCLSESSSGQPDRWTALDASWRDLFETAPAPARSRK